MKKVFYAVLLLLFTFYSVENLNAQVTIGTLDEPDATLDVKANSELQIADGVLVPRLTKTKLIAKDGSYNTPQNGALIFVNDAAGSPSLKTANVTATGFYYYDSKARAGEGLWMPLCSGQSPQPTKPEWFYMPPVPLEVTFYGTGDSRNEYSILLFEKFEESIDTKSKSSTGSSDTFSDVFPPGSAGDYDYYVVGYDDSVINIISINTNGELTYEIVKEADENTYINIVFVRNNN